MMQPRTHTAGRVGAGTIPAPRNDEATTLVVVQRDWNGWQKAMAPLASLEDVHWHQPAGAPRRLIHAYVPCSALLSGAVPHDCTSSGSPHRLLVCVLRQHTGPGVFERLVARADRRS